MKLKQVIFSALAVIGFGVSSYAQDIEGGLFLGTTEYQGDLTRKQVTLAQTKPSFGLLARYYFGPRINVKGNIYYGWIEGTDEDYTDDKSRERRNLSFTSNVLEFGAQGELNILPFISNSKRYRFAPYVFAGIALYHFNPKAKDPATGKTVDLQPLGTEGQNISGEGKSPYSLWQGAIPYGIGIKYSLGNFWNLGIEVGQRKLFTDYLDDVSGNYQKTPIDYNTVQGRMADPGYIKDVKVHRAREGVQRGNSSKEDMYVFAGFTLTKTLRRFSCTNF